MKKSLVLTLSTVFALNLAAGPAFAADSKTVNPFVDVPAQHWSYDAVQQLAAAGIIDGYGDKTFRGDKTITRYEMAELVARAMTKIDKADNENKKLINKLQDEYSQELRKMGVRLSKLEKKVDNVKWTGEMRMRYTNDTLKNDGEKIKDNTAEARARLMAEGRIGKDWKYFGRLTNTQDFRKSNNDNSFTLDYSYAQGKLGFGTLAGGRIPYAPAYGLVVDSNYNGVKVGFGNKLKANIFYGKESQSSLMLYDNKEYYLASKDILTPTFDAGGGYVDMLCKENGGSEKRAEFGELLKRLDKLPDNAYVKDLAYQLAYAKGYNPDKDKWEKTKDQKKADALTDTLNGLLAKKEVADTDMAGIELAYALNEKTNVKAAYLTFDAPDLEGLKAKMWEAGFDSRMSDDWAIQAVYGKSNAKQDNKAYVVGLTYKNLDVNKAKSFNIYGNYLNIERLATFNSTYGNDNGTYGTDTISNIIERGTADKEGNLHGSKGFEIGANYVFAKNVLFHTNMTNVKANDETNWKEKNYKAQMYLFF